MVQTCARCRRSNPAEALFCYHDGSPLANGDRTGRAARLRFPTPFVFPSGRACHSFDEFALNCLNEWPAARELLEQGVFEGFFFGLGRADLAAAAREARLEPDRDRDRGLDRLLWRLPAPALAPPRLEVQPGQVNLGALRVGQDVHFELHLFNRGMGLVHGSVALENAPWLAVGESGSATKVFQFLHEAAVAVQVRGRQLRAGLAPLEGQLVVSSSAGKAFVAVRAEVAPLSFPEGVLAGCLTPRQVAERARDAPREAATLFESGAVARWYQANGWTYPVQGPAAAGVAGIQQFFEALGVTKPPKVELDTTAVRLEGRPGDSLHHTLRLSTAEKRPVFARAVSDEPWLTAAVELDKRTANIHLTVAAVPDRPGQTLQAYVTVTANGRQRFVVPVGLAVAGQPRPAFVPPVPAVPRLVQADADIPMYKAVELDQWPADGPPVRTRTAVLPVALPADAAFEVVAANGPPPLPRARPAVEPFEVVEEAELAEPAEPVRVGRVIMPLVPVALLVVALLVAFVRDMAAWVASRPDPDVAAGLEGAGDERPRLALHFHDTDINVALATGGSVKPAGSTARDARPAVWAASMRFGLEMLQQGAGRRSLLTYDPRGLTNNVCVRLDSNEWLFGERPFRDPFGRDLGAWPGRWHDRDAPAEGGLVGGRRSVWVYDAEQVFITQSVGLVRGAQSGLLDTCLVRYTIENRDARPHKVGLRFLLDTFIGGNDGVPFLIPGDSRLCSSSRVFQRPEEVPDFIQAREREDLKDPGTIAHLQLKVGGGLEPPGRVTLGAWPNTELARLNPLCRQEKTKWEVPVLPIYQLKDSAVTLYWPEKEMPSGASREVGFTYGLGNVAGGEGGGKLAVTVGGSFVPGGEFTVTAFVNNPRPRQTVTLRLPDGLSLTGGEATQAVPALPPDAASRNSPVTWRVRADREGRFTLTVTSSTGESQAQPVRIKVRGIFGD
jgi:hypothetical protein